MYVKTNSNMSIFCYPWKTTSAECHISSSLCWLRFIQADWSSCRLKLICAEVHAGESGCELSFMLIELKLVLIKANYQSNYISISLLACVHTHTHTHIHALTYTYMSWAMLVMQQITRMIYLSSLPKEQSVHKVNKTKTK